MILFRQRIRTVEAVQWTGDNADEVEDFSGYEPSYWPGIEPGDWVIRWGEDDFIPLTAPLFLSMYEPLF